MIAALFAAGSQAVQEVGSDLVTWLGGEDAAEEVRGAITKTDPHAFVAIVAAKPPSWNEWRAFHSMTMTSPSLAWLAPPTIAFNAW